MAAHEFTIQVSTAAGPTGAAVRDSLVAHLDSLRPAVLAAEVWDVEEDDDAVMHYTATFTVEASTTHELTRNDLHDSLVEHIDSLRPGVLAAEVWDVVAG